MGPSTEEASLNVTHTISSSLIPHRMSSFRAPTPLAPTTQRHSLDAASSNRTTLYLPVSSWHGFSLVPASPAEACLPPRGVMGGGRGQRNAAPIYASPGARSSAPIPQPGPGKILQPSGTYKPYRVVKDVTRYGKLQSNVSALGRPRVGICGSM